MSISLSAPPMGDGETHVLLTVATRPRRLLSRITDFTITASAGRLDEANRTFLAYEARFLPPRLSTPMTVTVTAEARLGSRLLRAKKSFEVSPPKASAPETRTDGPLDLRIAPGHLVLGRDVSAKVTLRGTLDVPPVLHANVGSLSALHSTGDGRLQATYTAPDRFFPQVAIIVAIAPDGTIDWTSLPLWGSGEFSVNVESHDLVFARVRDLSFGPFRANSAGEVKLPIVAPPGVVTAETVLDGHPDAVHEFELGVPPFGRLLAVCPEHSSALVAFVVDELGAPQAGARLKVKSNIGSMGDPQMVSPGRYDVVFVPPQKTKLGTRAALTAELEGSSDSRDRCRTTVRGGEPKRVEVTTEPSFYLAGSGTPISISVQAWDEAGHPPTISTVSLKTHTGQVSTASSLGDGRFTAIWTIPDSFDNRRLAFLAATVQNGKNAVTAESSLELRPGKVTSIEVAPQRVDLRADGHSDLVVKARPLDPYGNPAFDATLTGSAQGELSAFGEPDAEGVIEARYVSPTSFEPTEDTISVRHANSDVQATVEVNLAASRPPFAAVVKAGYQSNLGSVSAPMAMVEAAMRLPLLDQRLQLAVAVGLSGRSTTRPVANADDTIKLSLWIVPLLVHATYRQPIGSLVEAYIGASGGCYAIRSRLESSYGSPMRGLSWRPALGGLLGVDVALGLGRLAAEAHYLHAEQDDLDLSGNVAGLLTAIGYRLEI